MDLALPAIGLWPQRRADIPAAASRFGGTPLAPPDWEWPTFEDEPMLFVGQIDCAELRGLPGAELLPPHGVLAFFGDHDAVQGGDFLGMSAVYHWPDADRLVAAQPPIEPILIFPACAVAPRPILDLPHPFSHAVSKLQLGKEERDAYFDAWLEIREHGIPRECVRYAGFSKLLGWPHLLQNDLWRFESRTMRASSFRSIPTATAKRCMGGVPAGASITCCPNAIYAHASTTTATSKVSSRDLAGAQSGPGILVKDLPRGTPSSARALLLCSLRFMRQGERNRCLDFCRITSRP